jgi:hypothetical protein
VAKNGAKVWMDLRERAFLVEAPHYPLTEKSLASAILPVKKELSENDSCQ